MSFISELVVKRIKKNATVIIMELNKMESRIILLFVILLSYSCKRNYPENSLRMLVNSDKFIKIMQFDSTTVVLKPNPNNFSGYTFLINKYNVDLFGRDSFTCFIKRYLKVKDIIFSELFLIETYSSGEEVIRRKSIVYKDKDKYHCLFFKRSFSDWIMEKDVTIDKKVYNRLREGLVKSEKLKIKKQEGLDYICIITFTNSKNTYTLRPCWYNFEIPSEFLYRKYKH